MTTRTFKALLFVMLICGIPSVALGEGAAAQTCHPEDPSELVRLAKPMGVGTWSGVYCGATIEGTARGHLNLLLLTDDGQLLRLQVSGCAHDLGLAQSPEAQALQDVTLQIRLSLTVGKSKTDPKSNELTEARDSTGKVIYLWDQCH
jgi:hypothetical protein